MTAMLVAPPAVPVPRRTITTGVVFDRRTRQFYDRCGLCGLQSFATTAGMLSGFFGAHHGADGTEPSCPVITGEVL